MIFWRPFLHWIILVMAIAVTFLQMSMSLRGWWHVLPELLANILVVITRIYYLHRHYTSPEEMAKILRKLKK